MTYKLKILFLLLISTNSFAQKLPSYKITHYKTSNEAGYYFFTANNNLIIMDTEANVIYQKPGNFVFDFVLEKKHMIYPTVDNFYIMDSTFNVIDSFACKNGIKNNPHDFIVMPNGNLLLLGTETVKMNLSSYPNRKKGINYDTASVIFTVIQEQDKAGNVVFEWHSKDHFKLTDGDAFLESQEIHSNSLALDSDGNILLSSRNLNEITKINRKDGTVIWRLGGKRNEFKFVICPTPFYVQHDIKRLDNGHFTLFDNGEHSPSLGARALEFDLDQKNKIAALVWSYTYDSTMSSNGRGNVSRLKNGNTLVSFGRRSKGEVCFVEVNPQGEKILEVEGPITYRVAFYPTLPFALKRPVIKCFDSAGVKYLDAGAGYSSYKWNTGDTTRTITVNGSGVYFAFVPYGRDGFVSSEFYLVGDPNTFQINKGLRENKKRVKVTSKNEKE